MMEYLPVELIAKIVSELDLTDVIKISQLSRRLRAIASDPVLNVWRLPILRNARSKDGDYEDALKNLSVYMGVPRTCWVDVLTNARASYILFDATLPNLREAEWEEAFKRRFLPSWRRWKKDSSWKAAFLRTLHQTWHRSCTSCTANEAWTKYIVLNRNGSANLLEVASRNFNPLVVLDNMRLQQNMHHLRMRARLVVQFADVRVLALGTLNRPRSHLTVNANAEVFLHPPGIYSDADGAVTPAIATALSMYSRLRYPLPAQTHANYPFHTLGGTDKRWIVSEEPEEVGLQWVGGLMIVAQILGQGVNDMSYDWPPLQDQDLVVGSGRQQYVSLTWDDLWAIAPWLEENITRQIDGPGLGI